MERVVLPALLAWAVFTNLLMFLPAPRNLPVAICRTSGSDGKTTTFYTLEFALRARRVEREIHGKAEHNRESDTLVVVSSIFSIVTGVFVAVAFFVVYVNKKKAPRTSRSEGLWLIYPVLGLSLATVILLSLSTVQREGCNHGSGFFMKVVEAAIYFALLYHVAQGSTEQGRAVTKMAVSRSTGDFSGVTKPQVSADMLNAQAEEFNPQDIRGQLRYA